jgi:hypothetical protein
MPTENIASVIKKASDTVGVPLPLMYAIANQESGFKAEAAAKTSSAKGLYQFISGTWKTMVAKYGDKYPILKQRGPEDPEANALAGALFIKENSQVLEKAKIPVNATSIYTAHFLGAGGAKQLFSLPSDAIAADKMPGPAKANDFIFYKKGENKKPDKNKPRTASEVVQVLFEKVGQYEEKYAQVLTQKTGTQLAQASTENKDLKSQGQGGTTVINNTTNVVKQGDRKENNMTVARNDSPVYTRTL